MTDLQKMEAAVQAVTDIFTTINAILIKHERAAHSYSIWYDERAGDAGTYSTYITRLACECIVNANLRVPSVSWELVEFDG